MGEVKEFKRTVEVCRYCGKGPHVTPLACPRIASLVVSGEGYIEGITFWDDFFDEEETPPAA